MKPNTNAYEAAIPIPSFTAPGMGRLYPKRARSGSGAGGYRRPAYDVMESTIPLMKNLRMKMNSRIVGIEVKMTAVMIQGMLPPP